MRGLCGWFSMHPVKDDTISLHRMLDAGHVLVTDATMTTADQAGLAVFGTSARPVLYEANGLIMVLAGHPRLRDCTQNPQDPGELASRIKARGKGALEGIGGDFAIAFWDMQRKKGLLAVDRAGVHQLVYTRTRDVLAFASTLDLLNGYPAVERRLSNQGIFDYLFYHVSPGPKTVFANQYRLAPGHCLELGMEAPLEPSRYWAMSFDEKHDQRPAAQEEEFIALIRSAVKENSDGAATGAFLSGGTDSSTISGMLSRVSREPARTFSIGFAVEGFDEMAYARIAAKHFGCEHHEYYVTPQDVVDAVPRIAAAYDQPFGNASAVPTYYCAKMAREHGVARLLAGDGGDELFGGNERYAKQHLFGLYERIPGLLRSSVIEPLMNHLPGVQRIPPLRKLRSYIEQARPPMPLRYQTYNLLNYLGQQNVFAPEFLASIDAGHPQAMMDEAHAPFAEASLINQMLAIDLRFVLADTDLPKVTRMCELADVDVAFPLLDDRLIGFSGHLPSRMKLRGTQLRWFFKHALRDFLPPAVIAKQKHGFGLPVGAWIVGHKPLLDLATDSISLLRSHGIVRPSFIDELFSARLREHSGYFGTMVWILMMLGLWMDSRRL